MLLHCLCSSGQHCCCNTVWSSSRCIFIVFFRDENGSIYLQTLAELLKEEFMNLSLERILTLVRRRMVVEMQVCIFIYESICDGKSLQFIGLEIHNLLTCFFQGKRCPEERNSLIFDVIFSQFYKNQSEARKVVSLQVIRLEPMWGIGSWFAGWSNSSQFTG